MASRDTFETVDSFVEEARENLGDTIPTAMIGTKADLIDKREVTQEQAERKAKELGVLYYEVSSKTGEGVDEAVEGLLREALTDEERAMEQDSKETSLDPGD